MATGFQKWGMSNGTAAAMMLLDSIIGKRQPLGRVFDSSRLNVRQSASDVVKRFVGDRLRTATDRSVDDLAPGDAAVLAVGAERVAAYRDDSGALHTVSPVCTHLGARSRGTPPRPPGTVPATGRALTAMGGSSRVWPYATSSPGTSAPDPVRWQCFGGRRRLNGPRPS